MSNKKVNSKMLKDLIKEVLEEAESLGPFHFSRLKQPIDVTKNFSSFQQIFQHPEYPGLSVDRKKEIANLLNQLVDKVIIYGHDKENTSKLAARLANIDPDLNYDHAKDNKNLQPDHFKSSDKLRRSQAIETQLKSQKQVEISIRPYPIKQLTDLIKLSDPTAKFERSASRFNKSIDRLRGKTPEEIKSMSFRSSPPRDTLPASPSALKTQSPARTTSAQIKTDIKDMIDKLIPGDEAIRELFSEFLGENEFEKISRIAESLLKEDTDAFDFEDFDNFFDNDGNVDSNNVPRVFRDTEEGNESKSKIFSAIDRVVDYVSKESNYKTKAGLKSKNLKFKNTKKPSRSSNTMEFYLKALSKMRNFFELESIGDDVSQMDRVELGQLMGTRRMGGTSGTGAGRLPQYAKIFSSAFGGTNFSERLQSLQQFSDRVVRMMGKDDITERLEGNVSENFSYLFALQSMAKVSQEIEETTAGGNINEALVAWLANGNVEGSSNSYADFTFEGDIPGTLKTTGPVSVSQPSAKNMPTTAIACPNGAGQTDSLQKIKDKLKNIVENVDTITFNKDQLLRVIVAQPNIIAKNASGEEVELPRGSSDASGLSSQQVTMSYRFHVIDVILAEFTSSYGSSAVRRYAYILMGKNVSDLNYDGFSTQNKVQSVTIAKPAGRTQNVSTFHKDSNLESVLTAAPVDLQITQSTIKKFVTPTNIKIDLSMYKGLDPDVVSRRILHSIDEDLSDALTSIQKIKESIYEWVRDNNTTAATMVDVHYEDLGKAIMGLRDDPTTATGGISESKKITANFLKKLIQETLKK